MIQGLIHLHNFLRWVILLFLVIAVIKHLTGMTARKPYTAGDKKFSSILMITTHTQFLIGLFLYFAGSVGLKMIQQMGMGPVMKEASTRYWAVEHILGMIVAITLITIAGGVGKKNLNDRQKHTRSFWLFFVALIIILLMMPWPFHSSAPRPLFPGMQV
jgi:hypothetical protein